MSNRLDNYPAEKPDTGKKTKRLGRVLKYAGYLIGLVIVVAVLYQLVFMVRLTAGISKEKPAPNHFVTIEIINASGTAQFSRQIEKRLNEYKNSDIIVTVTNAEKLDYKELEKSLVIARDENTELAKYVARIAGIDESEVVFRPALEDDMSPMVTLVLGEDMAQLLNPPKTNKES